MKLKMLLVAGCFLFTAGGVVHAQTVAYTNGAVNGTTNAYTFTGGTSLQVSDSFTVASSTDLISATAGVWVYATDLPTSTQWAIGTSQYGNDIASGYGFFQRTYLNSALSGAFDVYSVAFDINAHVDPATTYWFTLFNGNTGYSGNIFWDVNSGPSSAVDSALGSVDSESFTLYKNTSPPPRTPEPGTLAFALCSGLASIAALRKRTK